ncbi:hypothetical protein GCM10027175_15210 [Hymenobacter latericoloratus]
MEQGVGQVQDVGGGGLVGYAHGVDEGAEDDGQQFADFVLAVLAAELEELGRGGSLLEGKAGAELGDEDSRGLGGGLANQDAEGRIARKAHQLCCRVGARRGRQVSRGAGLGERV